MALSELANVRVRLWRFDGRGLRVSNGTDPGWQPEVPARGGAVPTPDGAVWLEPVPEATGFWLEVVPADGRAPESLAPDLAAVIGSALANEHEMAVISEELAGRYQEIDLLYTISEILGQTVRLKDAASTILRELSGVVGARRSSIMVHDEGKGLLRVVAARGASQEQMTPVTVDDPESIAARVFRDERLVAHDPKDPAPRVPPHPEDRHYRGAAFLCVPISYAAPGARSRCVGVMNFTDPLGGDAFSPSDRKLVAAVANQVGAAIENARLVIRDLKRQRIQQELALAHDLQLKLMPAPSVLQGAALVAARCVSAEEVGGDFYTFGRVSDDSIGVMFGDVSSHGFSAALVMALVLSAAGIHTGGTGTPSGTLEALHESLSTKLSSTEMFLTVFYGVLDRSAGTLTFANAGHQHAFRVPATGEPERLATTAPPMGLATGKAIGLSCVDWNPQTDLLCLWTDGLVEVRNAEGEAFGEDRLIEVLSRHRTAEPDAILETVFEEVESFGTKARDDRTLLVLRM